MVDVSHPDSLRVLLLGMRCGFTLPVAEALIAGPGVDVAGVVVPSDRPNRPMPSPGDEPALDVLLRQSRTPLIEAPSVRRRDLEPLLSRRELTPLDAIVAACFPWKVPRWLRALPRCGALNVHPSLLPALRGPEPAFWALRLGVRETGVTVHLMDDGLDTGPILAQRSVPVPPDVTLPDLERFLATVGGELAREALHTYGAGEARPREQVGVPSYAPAPTVYDLTVPTDLPAGWAARFVRAVAPVYAPVSVLVMATGQRLAVSDVVEADERATLATPIEEDGQIVAVRFSPGVVRFQRTGA